MFRRTSLPVLASGFAALLFACDTPPVTTTPERPDGSLPDAGGMSDGATDSGDTVQPDPACTGLFGKPTRATGLDETTCSPICTCGQQTWAPPEYSAAAIAKLKTWELSKPFAAIETDPYAAAAATPESPQAVCGVLPETRGGRRYALVSYESTAAARRAGAFITHTGSCGVCSTLADLSVYLGNQDLAEPVRTCALTSIGQAAQIECLQGLGFTLPCAQVWYFNTVNTRKECADTCLPLLGAPYHLSDGSLNACLQCDEDKSGPVFQAVAGRTRRNSGIANALCRPCSEVSRVEHVYE